MSRPATDVAFLSRAMPERALPNLNSLAREALPIAAEDKRSIAELRAAIVVSSAHHATRHAAAHAHVHYSSPARMSCARLLKRSRYRSEGSGVRFGDEKVAKWRLHAQTPV